MQQLETRRLLSRPFTMDDLEAAYQYAFAELSVRRIFASTNRKNAASIALMKRVGMRIAHNPERLDEDWPDAPGVLGVIEHQRADNVAPKRLSAKGAER